MLNYTVMDRRKCGICSKKHNRKVVDAATKQLLQGATITDLQNNLNRVTNANGRFSLPQNN